VIFDIDDALVFGGLVLMTVGFGLVYLPLAPITLGLALGALGILRSRTRGAPPEEPR
jgi:hypothetical protein